MTAGRPRARQERLRNTTQLRQQHEELWVRLWIQMCASGPKAAPCHSIMAGHPPSMHMRSLVYHAHQVTARAAGCGAEAGAQAALC